MTAQNGALTIEQAVKRGKSTGVLAAIEVQALEDSKAWFPEHSHDLPFLMLALTGEVGEAANIMKKIIRGSLDIRDAKVEYNLKMEITDIFIYLVNIAAALGMDLEAAYHVKRLENVGRFGADAGGEGSGS